MHLTAKSIPLVKISFCFLLLICTKNTYADYFAVTPTPMNIAQAVAIVPISACQNTKKHAHSHKKNSYTMSVYYVLNTWQGSILIPTTCYSIAPHSIHTKKTLIYPAYTFYQISYKAPELQGEIPLEDDRPFMDMGTADNDIQ